MVSGPGSITSVFFGSRHYVLPQRELLRWSWARDRRGGTYEFKGFDIFQESLYVADTDNSRIMKWTPGATKGEIIITGIYPMGIHVDNSGNIFVFLISSPNGGPSLATAR